MAPVSYPYVNIHPAATHGFRVDISELACQLVRIDFLPKNDDELAQECFEIKALAAALISKCHRLAKQNPNAKRLSEVGSMYAEAAAMWAVKAATEES